MWRALVLSVLSVLPGATQTADSELDQELLEAAGAGDAARIRRLIGASARLEARDADGFTALMRAAASPSAEAVGVLLDAGADAGARRLTGWTALMAAVSQGRLESARRLLAAGAPADARDRGLGTALEIAERAGHQALVGLLRRHGAQGSGRSVGDRVCVLRWGGAGFCGRIDEREGTRFRIRIDRIRGCERGCPADSDCTEGLEVGGDGSGAVGEASAVWTRSWCLTHSALE